MAAADPPQDDVSDAAQAPLAGGVLGTTNARSPGYALPYYTRLGSDTEYLISNPAAVVVDASLTVYGPECRPVGEPIEIHLDPNCTRSVRVRGIVPEYSGHAVLEMSRPLVVAILYLRRDAATVVGHAMAGRSALVGVPPRAAAATYGFGYRTLPFTSDTLEASLFVSNPNSVALGGQLSVYGERCELLDTQQIGVRPRCTREYPMPVGHYGLGRVRVLAPAVLNLLHFSGGAGGVTGAELLSERTEEPQPPQRAGILVDDTHFCRGAASGDLTVWESAVVSAGIPVGHLTAPPLTAAALQPYRALAVIMPQVSYDPAELQAISDFVHAGGGLLVCQEFGIPPSNDGASPWSWPTRGVMGAFGVTDDSNMALDLIHNEGEPSHIRFEVGRNFGVHPVVDGLCAISMVAACTLAGAGAAAAAVVTDTDTSPPSSAVVLEREVGSGRVLVLGDSNILSDSWIGEHENRAFAVRCAERTVFRI